MANGFHKLNLNHRINYQYSMHFLTFPSTPAHTAQQPSLLLRVRVISDCSISGVSVLIIIINMKICLLVLLLLLWMVTGGSKAEGQIV